MAHGSGRKGALAWPFWGVKIKVSRSDSSVKCYILISVSKQPLRPVAECAERGIGSTPQTMG